MGHVLISQQISHVTQIYSVLHEVEGPKRDAVFIPSWLIKLTQVEVTLFHRIFHIQFENKTNPSVSVGKTDCFLDETKYLDLYI